MPKRKKRKTIPTHIQVPAGEWVDVPRTHVMAPGTYIDDEGVLRASSDGSVAAWHTKGCYRKGLQPSDLIYRNGAPWCPDCSKNLDDREKMKKLATIFPSGPTHHSPSNYKIDPPERFD